MLLRLPAQPKPQLTVGRKQSHHVDPLVGCGGQESRHPGLDQLVIQPHGIGHDRQARGLVLKHLQPALAAAPEVIRQPAYPDLSGSQVARLPFLGPRTRGMTGSLCRLGN